MRYLSKTLPAAANYRAGAHISSIVFAAKIGLRTGAEVSTAGGAPSIGTSLSGLNREIQWWRGEAYGVIKQSRAQSSSVRRVTDRNYVLWNIITFNFRFIGEGVKLSPSFESFATLPVSLLVGPGVSDVPFDHFLVVLLQF